MSEPKKVACVERVMQQSSGLHRTMPIKSAVMVGVGGTLGTGLFLSSGDVLSTVGPWGAIILYIIGGFIAWLMTACLGEMSAAMPVSGAQQAYATEFCGPALGMTIGWVGWVGGATTISAQVVASAIIMRDVIPGSPTWLWIVVFALVMLGLNMLDAKLFGEISFWASTLKLLLVVAFIIVGAAMLFGGFGYDAAAVSHSAGEEKVTLLAMCGCILTSFYAYAGTEIIGSTAGELKDENKMGTTINLTIIVLLAVVLVCIAFVCMLLPADQADVLGSPFAYIFRNAGLDSAALVVNLIVLTSALTSGNYFVYESSRYLWSMAKFGQAPKFFATTNKKGVPVRALGISMICGMAAIIAEFVAPDTVYVFILYLIGGCNIFLYTVICASCYRFRKKYIADGGKVEDLKYKTPAFPLVPILGIIAFMLMLVATLVDPGERVGIIVCAILYLAIYIGCRIFVKKKGADAVKNVSV